ncbi:MAG: hypothetical protein QOF63_1371 [Thermoanaerobaculia bacterium]|jgi:hypothetical protein|nr:hypothetical protein [Thermoanaerobaculia bacterium]
MGNERDVFEWRRFGHWESSAAKARFAAFVLWHIAHDSRYAKLTHAAGHKSDDAGLGLFEAFRRESAVALELVVKAVIASKLIARGADPSKEGVPATHDLPKLWSDAGLPPLEKEDKYRLQEVKSVLTWSGRYPTPRTVKAWEEETREFAALEDTPSASRFVIRTPTALGWIEFDRLYQVAHEAIV